MRAILVDDEYYALQGLKLELEQLEGIEITGMFDQADDALRAVQGGIGDVIFLDINMPKMNGMELSRIIIEEAPHLKIVYVTAYSEYAVEAFEINAVDYIVKPARKERLIKTISRIRSGPAADIQHGLHAESFRFHCFLHFSVSIGLNELNSKWRTKKAEELLAYLIKEKGRYVSKERIAEALWPDLDGRKGIANLYLAYHYLKKQSEELGVCFPVESRRGKMRIVLDDVYCDLIEFDGCLKKCAIINEMNVEYAKRALELYGGMPFEDNYYSWTVQMQQVYEVAYTELLNRLIAYYEANGYQEHAIFYKGKLFEYET